jgi:large subunit ribosomal protein L24
MRKIKKGDDVIILAGKDRGKRGTVSKLIGHTHVHVQGVNVVKKHQKPNPSTGASGGIVNLDLPIHLSNIGLYNFSLKKADRVGLEYDSDGKKIRVFKSDGEKI